MPTVTYSRKEAQAKIEAEKKKQAIPLPYPYWNLATEVPASQPYVSGQPAKPAYVAPEGYVVESVTPTTVMKEGPGSRVPFPQQALAITLKKEEPLLAAIRSEPSLINEPEIIAALKQTPEERAIRQARANVLITIGGPFVVAAVFPPALVSLPNVLVGAGVSVGVSEAVKVVTTGEHLTLEETAQTSLTGAAVTAGASIVIGKVATPLVEKWLVKSYRGAVEAGKLWTPTTTQKVAMALTGAKTPTLASQIVSMPKEVGLAEFEFAVSPRSSALFMPLPKAPSFAPQLISIPYKEIMIETGKAMPVISKSLLEAQEMAWELQTTPKTSGVMLWKLTTQETEKHFVHLISRQGYTTIGPLIYEKPFSAGFLSAPSGALITTTVTRTTGKKMPYYPQMLETPKQLTRTIPYTPEITGSMGKASSIIGFPVLTPTKPKALTKSVISPITTPYLFPGVAAKAEPSRIVVPAAILKSIVGTQQKQVVIPISKMDIPTPEIPTPPKLKIPTPETPPWTPPSPPFEVPKTPSFPFYPRGGGEAGGRSFENLFGKWFPRTHKVKTWEQQLKTFGLGKAPKGLGKFGKMEVPKFGGFKMPKISLGKTKQTRKKRRRRKR